jgi:hypothetical protein
MIAVTSIEVRCRHCGANFCLRDLLVEQSGRCPSCQVLLAPEWTPVLLEEAANAENAQGVLVQALRRLVGIPGQLEVLPGSLVRNLFEEIGWEAAPPSDPHTIERELRLLRWEIASWERAQTIDHREDAGVLRHIAARLRQLAKAPASRSGDSADLDQAADALDIQADRLAEHRESRDDLLACIDAASQLVRDRGSDR